MTSIGHGRSKRWLDGLSRVHLRSEGIGTFRSVAMKRPKTVA